MINEWERREKQAVDYLSVSRRVVRERPIIEAMPGYVVTAEDADFARIMDGRIAHEAREATWCAEAKEAWRQVVLYMADKQ